MGPERLIADDLTAGRLVLPFAGPALPARSYYTYVPAARTVDPAIRAFCGWLAAGGGAAMSRSFAAPGGKGRSWSGAPPPPGP